MADGVHVSRRTVAAIAAAVTLILATWKVARAIDHQVDRVNELERSKTETHLRMCQWERAFQQQGFKIAPWPTCPVTP